MSTTPSTDVELAGNLAKTSPSREPGHNGKSSNYKGFVAGLFSGSAKLIIGHPFDTIKVRLQTADRNHFKGPLDCVLQTVRREGIAGLYKGATPPLVGWVFMDSLLMGSLTLYRRVLHENIFTEHVLRAYVPAPMALSERTIRDSSTRLPALGHAVAGTLAGWTVSCIAAPVEHIKARLQIQYAAPKALRFYSGPIDCTTKILRTHGIRGLYRGFGATVFFRSFFFIWWGSYDVLSRAFEAHTSLSTPAVNFWAGGLSAQLFWILSYPADVVKQRLMTDPLGGVLGDGQRRFPRWKDAAAEVWRADGPKGFWRGFVPCFLRAFPANAMAIVAFEGVMRALPD